MWKYIFAAFFFSFVYVSVGAQKVAIAPEPVWLCTTSAGSPRQFAAKDIAGGYYLQEMDRQVDLASQTEYLHYTRVIVNETGVQRASEVSVSFSPEYQKIVFHKLSVIRDGVEVSKVNVASIKVVQEETDVDDYQYNGMKRAFVVLKDVRSNDRIDVSYSLVGFNPVYGNRYTSEIYFTSGITIGSYTESLLVPLGRSVNIKSFNHAPLPQKTMRGSTTVYQWVNPVLKTSESQPNTPVWFNNEPYVSMTEFTNWKEVNEWGLALFGNYKVPVSPALKSKIEELKKEAGGNTHIYGSLATKFVQDKIRYLGMEIGIYTHQPHLPSEVFAQRYGDCKDKAFLLAVMLREGGIPAYVAFASTQLRATLTQQDASPYKFNHVIVAAEQGTDYKFIDATISYQRGRFEDLYIPNYGAALVIREGTNALNLFRLGNIRQTTIEEKLYVSERNGENSLLEVKTVYEGGSADINRSSIADYGAADLENSYRGFYARIYDSVISKNEVDIDDDSLNNRIRVKEAYRIPNIWRSDEKGQEYLSLYAHFLSDVLPDPSSSFKYGPLALPYPQEMHYSLEVNLPAVWNFPSDDYHISNGSYEFDFKVHRNGKQVTLEYYFKTFKDHIPYEDVARYKADYKKITSVLEYTLPRDGAGVTGTFSVNFLSVGLAMLLIALMIFAFRKLNRRSVETHYIAGTGRKLGGWLIVLAIGMVIQFCVNAYGLYADAVFDKSTWDALGSTGGFALQSVLLAELTALMLLLGACGAILYWFFRRRDIFPRMFAGFVILNFSCHLLLAVVYAFAPLPDILQDANADLFQRMFRIIVYGAIWVSYIFRSQRVKETFIEPYLYIPPENMAEESGENGEAGADQPETKEPPGSDPDSAVTNNEQPVFS